jgi:hypothetical protein
VAIPRGFPVGISYPNLNSFAHVTRSGSLPLTPFQRECSALAAEINQNRADLISAARSFRALGWRLGVGLGFDATKAGSIGRAGDGTFEDALMVRLWKSMIKLDNQQSQGENLSAPSLETRIPLAKLFFISKSFCAVNPNLLLAVEQPAVFVVLPKGRAQLSSKHENVDPRAIRKNPQSRPVFSSLTFRWFSQDLESAELGTLSCASSCERRIINLRTSLGKRQADTAELNIR